MREAVGLIPCRGMALRSSDPFTSSKNAHWWQSDHFRNRVNFQPSRCARAAAIDDLREEGRSLGAL
jgi:hypothetical protein